MTRPVRAVQCLSCVGAVLACVLLSACGGSGSSKRSAQTASSSSGSSSSTLVVVSPVGVPSLDGETLSTSTQQEVLSNVGEPMLRFKPLTQTTSQGIPVGSDTKFVGGACAHFSLSGKTFHCTLGHWVSPYGNVMTSKDVKFTLEYLIAAKATGLVSMENAGINLKDPITVLSPTKFNINLVGHDTTLESALTFWVFDPLDAVEVEKHATKRDPFARSWLATHTAMFGPYTATSIIPDQEVDLVKNPKYTGDKAADVPVATYRKVVYKAVPSDGTRAQLLCSGAAQFAKALNVDLYEPLKSCSSVKTYTLPYIAEPTLYFNVKRAPFDDADLRKAISCAVNTKQISNSVYDGQWKPATALLGPKLSSESGDFVVCPTQDLAKAKLYLKAAHYAGQTLPLYYSVGNSGQDAQENATIIEADLTEAGIHTTLESVPDATKYFADASTGQYGMYIFLWGANVPTAGWALGSWFGPGSLLNGTDFTTPQLVSDLDTMRTTPLTSSAQTRAAIGFQKQYLQNAVLDPLVYSVNDIVVNKSVCGLRSDPGDFPFWQYLHPCS